MARHVVRDAPDVVGGPAHVGVRSYGFVGLLSGRSRSHRTGFLYDNSIGHEVALVVCAGAMAEGMARVDPIGDLWISSLRL